MTGVASSNASRASRTLPPDQDMKLFRLTREPVGMANASSTPAMVEWTPDMNTQYHSATPTKRYGTSE